MNMSLLSWVGIVAGAAAVVVYFAVIALRPRLVRMINGFGLFFTGLGLMQAGLLVRAAAPTSWMNADLAIAALTIAAAMQGYAALRNRSVWDGAERRLV